MDTSPQEELTQEIVVPFVIAAHGDAAKVREMLGEHPGLLNLPWAQFDETAIQAASHMGNREIALYLLEQGAPTSICTAAMLGNVDEVTAYLQEHPALSGARGAHGIPLLYHAALSGHTGVTDLLYNAGSREGLDDGLHAAVDFGHTDMVRWLLDHGVGNVNVLSFDKKTPLGKASEKGHNEIVALLEQHGGLKEVAADAQ